VNVRAARAESNTLRVILFPSAGRASRLPWTYAPNPASQSEHPSWIAPIHAPQ
jgi:hypothetical protein